MQVAASVYPASQPLSAYHSIYHPPLTNHDHELKRTYLGLLPPQQIIEICLTFDLHVSPYIKSTVWPLDLNGAIAGLRKAAEEKDDENTTADGNGRGKDSNGEAIMDSLAEVPRAPTPAPDEPPEKPAEEPRPPDKDVGEQTDEAGALASSSTSSATPAASSTTPAPATSMPAPAPAQASPSTASAPPVPAAALPHTYPHQPYGYTYPHAPYYAPHSAYPYSHAQYPTYPHQYPQAPGYPPPPTYHHPPAPHAPPAMQDVADEDLPSYEEMIVEALQEANDPEGCAPKDLFTWMASRYPLQSNFRPSASQALQKAFKRGRLEKNTNNKYKLNPSWEGGSTSRRTTRRPQTQSSANNLTSSPFTHAPLVHHHQNQHPYSYGYPYSQHPSAAHTRPLPQPAAPQAQAQPPAPENNTSPAPAEPKTTEPPEVTSKDAYEAAQSILNAINFGDLLPLAEDDIQPGAGDVDANTRPVASTSTARAEAGTTNASNEGSARAELQAQLVLLATQLTALAKMDDQVAPTPAITISPLRQSTNSPSHGATQMVPAAVSTVQSVPRYQPQAYYPQTQPPVHLLPAAGPSVQYQPPSQPAAQYQPTQSQYAAQYYSAQGSVHNQQPQAQQSPASSVKSPNQPQQQPLVHILQAHQSFSLPYQAPAQRSAPSPQAFTTYTPAPPVPQYQKPQQALQEPPMLGLQPPASPPQAVAPTSPPTPSAPAQVNAPSLVSPWPSASTPTIPSSTAWAPPQAPLPEVPPPPQVTSFQPLVTEPAPRAIAEPAPQPPPPPAAAEGNEEEDTSFDSGSDTESDDDMEEVI